MCALGLAAGVAAIRVEANLAVRLVAAVIVRSSGPANNSASAQHRDDSDKHKQRREFSH